MKMRNSGFSVDSMQIKVLLVEDHELVRDGIKSLLNSHPNISVVGEASNGAEAIDKINTLIPDLILMDLNMPVMNGQECTKFIKRNFPEIKILILSMHDNENYLLEIIEAGADGYILKSSSKEELIFAIKKVANGGIYIGSEFTKNIISKFKSTLPKNISKDVNIDLSDREKSVLKLISEGYTNNEIADKLFTSIRTIETRRKRLLDKTGTTNTATLIHFAVKSGLI
jgi:DNA-binding NarL/FixJ family response regulator